MIPVEGHKNLFRDESTGAIINCDNTAYQNFTKNGPIAFLPISESETSIVYSFKSIDKKNNFEMNNLIKRYNPIYFIKKINNWNSFKLRSSTLRNYYKDNILLTSIELDQDTWLGFLREQKAINTSPVASQIFPTHSPLKFFN